MVQLSEQKIEEILTRSVAEILPSKEEFKKALCGGKKLRIYVGADATAPHLHIGHATNFILLEKLRQLGHTAIVLFGDFTAMIGDPTDKMAARVRLNRKQVEKNIKTWKEQVSKILDFNDVKNPARVVQNSKWFSKLTLSDMIEIDSNFTVQRMLERDMFKKRLKEEKPVYLHEFRYPLMQGYDSVVLDVDCEIGGTDQIFNMLCGRDLQKKYHNKEKFVIATTLLVNPLTGRKLMSKSEGNYIALDDEPNEMFGKAMALPDEAMPQVFTDCTYFSLEEIGKIERDLKNDKLNPRDIKEKLSFELVKMYHCPREAEKAQKEFRRIFSSKEAPCRMPKVKISKKDIPIVDLLLEVKFAPSRSEAKRLIEGGAVKINNRRILNWQEIIKLKNDAVLRAGKRKFVKIILKDHLSA